MNLEADVLTENRRVNFVEVGGARGERLAPGKRTVNHDTLEDSDRDLWGLSGTVDYTFDSGHKLTSITAYRYGHSYFINDNDATPVPQTTAPFTDIMGQFTQELRISSPQEGRLRYVAGAFYMYQDTLTEHNFTMGPRLGDPTVENDFLVGVPGFPTGVYGIDRSKHHIVTKSYAFFGNAEYDLMDKLTLILGLRYTHESKDLEGQETGTPILFIPPVPKFSDSLTDQDLSPTAGLSYSFTDKIHTYFRWSRGFRSGGYNNDLFIPSNQIKFRSEQVDSYEIGLKTQFWDDRIRFNIDGFYTDYKDLQQPAFDDKAKVPYITITNAGSAVVKGVEADYAAVLTDTLTLSGGFSYTSAKFKEFRNVLVLGDNFAGYRLPKVPEWTANASLQYQVTIPNFDGDFIARIDWSYRSNLFSETRNDPRELVGGRSLVNGRIGVTVGDNWELFFWGKNILNEDYLNERRVVDAFGQTWLNWGKPRSYGVTASYRY